MTGIFAKWEAERQLSTMQRIAEENARLRRWKKINEYVALVAWLSAFGMAVYFYWRA